MSTKVFKTFKINLDEIKKTPGYPSKERLYKGPVAVIECPEEIPCNPCEAICTRNAIIVGSHITNLPRFNYNKCDGCGKCISICPGLAIFVVNNTYSKSEVTISVPYEIVFLPEKGESVDAVDRNGNVVCEGTVVRIQNPKSFDRTAVITFTAPKKYSDIVRNFKRKKGTR